eukprot:3526621-Alexandrium_andersonii.AAC.1
MTWPSTNPMTCQQHNGLAPGAMDVTLSAEEARARARLARTHPAEGCELANATTERPHARSRASKRKDQGQANTRKPS